MLQRTRLFFLSLIWLFLSFYMGLYTKSVLLGYVATDLLVFAAFYTGARSIFPQIKRPGRLPLLLLGFSLALMLLFCIAPQCRDIFLQSYLPARIFRGAYTPWNLLVFAIGASLFTLWEAARYHINRTNPQKLHSPLLSSARMEYLLLACEIPVLLLFMPFHFPYRIATVPSIYFWARYVCPTIKHPGLMPLLSFALVWLLTLAKASALLTDSAHVIFSWTDVLCYAIGFVPLLLWELLPICQRKRSSTHENTDPQRLASS